MDRMLDLARTRGHGQLHAVLDARFDARLERAFCLLDGFLDGVFDNALGHQYSSRKSAFILSSTLGDGALVFAMYFCWNSPRTGAPE